MASQNGNRGAGVKRNKLQRARDEQIICRLFLQGLSTSEIAAQLPEEDGVGYTISIPVIQTHVKAIKKRWLEQDDEAINYTRNRLTTELTLLKKICYQQFDRSLRPGVMKEVTKGVARKDRKTNKITIEPKEVQRFEQKIGEGEIAYLRLIKDLIGLEAELAGLGTPEVNIDQTQRIIVVANNWVNKSIPTELPVTIEVPGEFSPSDELPPLPDDEEEGDDGD